MRIGELAARAGVSVQTVRFYEREKLLPTPERTESGYRVYGDEDLRRLRFIRQAKALGFSLVEIREILRMRGRGECPCGEVISIAEKHLRRAGTQIRQLQSFTRELNRTVKQWKDSGESTLSADAMCILIERSLKTGER